MKNTETTTEEKRVEEEEERDKRDMQNKKMIKARKMSNCCSQNKKQKQQKKKENSFALACLPDDIISGVLSCLPATCLLSSMRYVCKPWASIIREPRFPQMHLRHAKPGVFMQRLIPPYGARFLEIKGNGKFEITNLSPSYPGIFVDSVDGLALFRFWPRKMYYVANPLTMQAVVPVTPPESHRLDQYSDCACGIARGPVSGELKLVFFLGDFSYVRHWYVLRFGLDSTWRKITGIAPMRRDNCSPKGTVPLYIGGYLYWIQDRRIMVMDVDREAICLYDSPCGNPWRAFYKLGDYLSCGRVVHQHTLEILLLDIDSGSWTCYHRCMLPLYPLVACRPVLFDVCLDQQLIISAFGSRGFTYVAYDMETQKARSLKRFINKRERIYIHTNSLLPVNCPP